MLSRRNALRTILLGGTSLALLPPSRAVAGTVAGFGGSTEFTQIANNIQLLGNVGNTALTASRMAANLVNQGLQIANQVSAFTNMVQNTLTIPSTLLDLFKDNFQQLYDIFTMGRGLTGQGIASDRAVRNRFMTVEEYRQSPLNQAQLETRFIEQDENLKDIASDHEELLDKLLKEGDRELTPIQTLIGGLDTPNRNEILKNTGELIAKMIDVLKRTELLALKQSELTQEYKQTEMDKEAAQNAKEEDYLLRDFRDPPSTP